MKSRDDIPLVTALCFRGMGIFEYACASEIFAMARRADGDPAYRFATCALEPPPIVALGGIRLDAPHDLSLLDQAHTIVIPGWRDPAEKPPASLLMKLRQAHMRGARICSLCSGAFVLGWAGLLDGRSATTHWRLVDDFQRRFPGSQVQPDALYVDEGSILTSAGSSAAMDLLLHLVEQDLGRAAAHAIARRLLILPHRVGGQAQFTDISLREPAARRDRLDRLMEDITASLALPHTAASMARQASMSQRTLQRIFLARTSLTPSAWLNHQRVNLARQLLEHPGQNLSDLGLLTGFNSDESLRRHFRRQVGVSPSQYRRTFQAKAAGTETAIVPLLSDEEAPLAQTARSGTLRDHAHALLTAP